MYRLLILLLLPVSTLAQTPPDIDSDGVLDWAECALEDDGLVCSDQADNCLNVYNPSQNISPGYVGDEDKSIGTACDYDIDQDGVGGTLSDYNLLRYIVDTVNNYGNHLGDMTDDGYLTDADWCLFLDRNWQLLSTGEVFLPGGCSVP